MPSLRAPMTKERNRLLAFSKQGLFKLYFPHVHLTSRVLGRVYPPHRHIAAPVAAQRSLPFA